MNNKKLRTGISYLFTFFMAFFVFVMVLGTSVRFTVMDEGYFLSRMEKVDYYENTATQITRVIKQKGRGAGFKVETFDQFVEEEDVRDAMITYEKAMMDGKNEEISTDAFKKKLNTQINSYIKKNKIKKSKEMNAAIKVFVKECEDSYQYLAQFPYLDVYGKVMHLYQKAYLIGMPILLGITVLLGYLIRRMHTSVRKCKRYYAYGLIGSGLLISAAPLYLFAVRFFERINLEPEYMYDLLVAITKNLLLINIIVGILLIMIGGFITYFKPRKKKKKTKKGQKERTYPENGLVSKLELDTEKE